MRDPYTTGIDTLANKVFALERLAIIRDLFVFSCYTCLAYDDVKKLKRSEISTGVDGGKWEIADLCGITKSMTFHTARHTFATTATLTNVVPIGTVSKVLGHSIRYDRIVTYLESKAVVHGALHTTPGLQLFRAIVIYFLKLFLICLITPSRSFFTALIKSVA